MSLPGLPPYCYPTAIISAAVINDHADDVNVPPTASPTLLADN